MKDKCSILVNSCDKYSDTWYPFFKLFNKYWSECEMPIYLNTESLSYKDEEINVICFQFYKNSDVSWGKRFLKHVKNINSEYILVLLDDFFIRDNVDNEKINQIIEWMDQDKSIACFSLETVIDEKNIKDNKYTGFELRNNKGDYLMNLQAGIYRKEVLENITKNNYTPWDFEKYGTIRAYNTNLNFYTRIHESKKIIDYGFNQYDNSEFSGLWSIVKGKWVVESVDDLFKSNNIKVDYSNIGIYDINSKVIIKENTPDFSIISFSRFLYVIKYHTNLINKVGLKKWYKYR